ncbi:hypothetical protein ABGB12_00565 [Actinocorallia sp. B10E7]|uniref:hypothetical protein n=1 Tax=Actinocorallia sp. B10E7 TaxID=3153558 RepID=UPI00325CF4D4
MFGNNIYQSDNSALVGNSPQQVHERLWMEGRERRWKTRARNAVIITALAWWLVNPVIAVVAGLAYIATDLLVEAQKRLTTRVWRRGESGASHTARILKVLELRGYSVLHRRVVPGYGPFPHLVVGDGRVWLVENQVYSPEDTLLSVKGRLFVGKASHAHVVAKLEKLAQSVSEALSGDLGVPVKASIIVAVHGGKPKDTRMTAGGVVLMRPWRIPSWIHRRSAGKSGAVSVQELSSRVLHLYGPSLQGLRGELD